MKGIYKKIVSIFLVASMIITGNGVSGLKLKDVFASDATIELINGTLGSSDGLYDGNTIGEAILGNTSTNASDDLYMDVGSFVEFDIATQNSSGYSFYLAENATGENKLTQSLNFEGRKIDEFDELGENIEIHYGDDVSTCTSDMASSSTYYGVKKHKYIDYEPGKDPNTGETVMLPVEKEINVAFDLFSVEYENNHIKIKSHKDTKQSINYRDTYYLNFIDKNGGFKWTLNIHVMFKATYDNCSIKANAVFVRQGRNIVLDVKMKNNKDLITDGFDWKVVNGDNVQSEEVLGTVTTNKQGTTRFSQESSATFHADSDKGTGSVVITASTNSGIMLEDGAKACIALGYRGTPFEITVPIVEWVPATEISFSNEEYIIQVGSTIELNKLITAKSASATNPNDEYTFTIPTSQGKYATITKVAGQSTMQLVKPGKVELTCTAENTSVTAKCIINIIKPTTNLTLSINGEIVSRYEPTTTKNATIRSGNEFIVTAEESTGSDEELIWNEDKWNGLLTAELISDVDNVKVYRIKASDVTEPTSVTMELGTNRTKIGGNDPGEVKASYLLNIYPMITDENPLITSVSYDGEEKYPTDSLDLYSGESVVVYAKPEGILNTEPVDQIDWTIPQNSAYILKEDYKTLESTNVLNATTIYWLDDGEEASVLRATSKSNPGISKDLIINTKTSIENIGLEVDNLTSPTLNVGDSAVIKPTIYPEGADEEIEFVSQYPDMVSVDQDGKITALKATDANGVVIYVYAYHERFDNPKANRRLMATIIVKVKKIGSIEVKYDAERQYTDSTYSVTAYAYEEGQGSQALSDDTIVNWSIVDEKVASIFGSTTGKTIDIKPEKVGTTEVVASVGSGEGNNPVTGKAFLTVTAPITDSNIDISNMNLNTSSTPDDNAYRYLPNGARQDITPVLTATGIDSRANAYDEYVLVEGTDYNVSDSFVEGRGIGTYSIRFTGNELYTGSKSVNYRIFPKVLGDDVNRDGEIYVEEVGKLVYNGQVQKPNLKITYRNSKGSQELVLGTDYTLSDGNTVAGDYSIVVTGKGNFTGSFIVDYTIHQFDLEENFGETLKYKKTNANEYVISGSVPDQIWNGTEVCPNSQVLVYAKLVEGKETWTKLVEGKDYTVEFENNTGVGIATAIITGIGNYVEEVRCDYRIVEKDISIDNTGGKKATVAEIGTQVYTGFEVTPKVTVTCNEVLLQEGIDYELSYSDNIDANVKSKKIPKVIITGIGNYSGTISKNFTIRPANISETDLADGLINTEEIGEVIYNGSTQVPTLDIKYTNDEGTLNLVKDEDYSLAASGVNVGEGYPVTVTGKGNYTGSYVFYFDIKPYKLLDKFGVDVKYQNANKEFVTEGSVEDQVYNGTEVTPNGKILVYTWLKGQSGSATKLIENTDYTVEFVDNDRVGQARAIITGKGNYSQSINCDFNIIQRDISAKIANLSDKATIAPIDNQVYTGFEIEPKVTVTCNSIELVENVDYVLSYEDNIDTNIKSGKKPTVIVTGIGNYTGSISANFTIVQADLSDTTLVQIDEIPDQYDCGTLLVPPITVRMGEYTLIEGADYKVYYGKQNSTEYNYQMGTQGVVTIEPVVKGNFTANTYTTVRNIKGSEQFFDIVEKSVSSNADDVSIKQENGEALINDAIYVNVARAGAVNSTLNFDIEAVRFDNTECDDIVLVYADANDLFTYVVTPEDSTNGNKATLSITGKKAGRMKISLLTKTGVSKYVDVIVNDPATSVNAIIKDREGKTVTIDSSTNQCALFENHDYFLEPVLSVGKTDTVSWSVSNEEYATINEDGKLTTKKPGTVYVTVTTNPSEVSPGGVSKQITCIIKENVLAENVFINNKQNLSVDLKYDKTMELTGTSISKEGANVSEELLWSSSNEDAVQIIAGQGTGKAVIKAVGPGSAIITYGSKLEAGVKATCTVNVTYDVTGVELSDNEQSIIVSDSFELTATFNENAEDEFIWTVDKEDVVSISEYDSEKHNSQTVDITGLKPGTATITVKSKNYNKTATCRINVVHAYAKEAFINGNNNQTIEMMNGDTLVLTGSAISDLGKVTEELTWETDNRYIVDIIETTEDGKATIKALMPGEVTVSYGSTVKDGARARLKILVSNPVTGIMFDDGDREVHVGSTLTLGARFNAFAKGEMVITNTNDDVVQVTGTAEGICEYQDINVKGLKAGTSTITITAKGTELSDSVEITVLDNMVSAATINGEVDSECKLKFDDTMVLSGLATSETGDVTEKLTWKSSNEDAVKIVDGADTNEVTVKAVGPGSSVISFGSDAEGGIRAKCTVNVYYEVTEVKFDVTELIMTASLKKQLTARFNEYAEDEFIWTSSDETILKVNNLNSGVANEQTVTLEALKAGSVNVTAKSKSYGTKSTITVTVVDNKASKVLINGQISSSKTLKVNETMELVGVAEATEGKVTEKLTWTSSNDKVVQIVTNDGNGKASVKAVGAGNAVITFGSASGIKAIVTITVEKEAVTPTVNPQDENQVKEGPKAGSVISDSKLKYKVTKAGTSNTPGEVSIKTVVSKNAKSVVIPDNVTINGITYKVTVIENNAFKNNKKLVKVTIGKNIIRIGTKAFFGCKKLKKVTVKSTVLKKIGKKAFYRKGGKKLTFKVPKSKKKNYKKLIKKAKTNKYVVR